MALCSSHAAEIESVIPVYSVGYAVVRNVPEIWDSMKSSSSWQALLSTDELKDETRDIETWTKGLLDVDLRSLAEIFGHRIAFVQMRMAVMTTKLPVVIADVSSSEGASEMVWKIQQALSRHEEYEVQPNAGTYMTVPFGLVKHRESEFSVRYAFLDNLFVLAPEQNAFEAVVDVYLGREPSLIYDPEFNKARAQVSTEGEVFVYVNLECPWPALLSIWRSKESSILQILGIRGIKSIAWTMNLLAPNREQEAYIYTGSNRGLLTSLFANPKPLLSPHLIPGSDADLFFAAHLGDPVLAWENILNAVRNVMGERGHVLTAISEFERQTGLNVRDDVLSSLTGEVGFVVSVPEIMKSVVSPISLVENGLMMFCGVKDREKCLTSIQRILSAADFQLEQMEHKGVMVYHIPALSGMETPIGYMFADDLLIFGDLQRLEHLINEEPPLMVSDEFAQINSQFPEQLGLLFCVDLKKIGELLLMTNPRIQPEDDIVRLQTLGSTGGIVIYEREGLKAKTISTTGKSWLETIGDLAYLLIHEPF